MSQKKMSFYIKHSFTQRTDVRKLYENLLNIYAVYFPKQARNYFSTPGA